MSKRKVEDEPPADENPAPLKELRMYNDLVDEVPASDSSSTKEPRMGNSLVDEVPASDNSGSTKELRMEDYLEDKALMDRNAITPTKNEPMLGVTVENILDIGQAPGGDKLSPATKVSLFDNDINHLHNSLDMSPKAIKLMQQNGISNIAILLTKKTELAETSLVGINRGTQKKLHKFCKWHGHFYKTHDIGIDWMEHFDEDTLDSFDENKGLLAEDLELVCSQMSNEVQKQLAKLRITTVKDLLEKKGEMENKFLLSVSRGYQKQLHKFCMWYEYFYKNHESNIDWREHFDKDTLDGFDENKVLLSEDLELVCCEMGIPNEARKELAKLKITTAKDLLDKKEELELFALAGVKKVSQQSLLKFVLWRKEYELKYESANGWQDKFNEDIIVKYEPENEVEKQYRNILDRLHEGQSDGGIGEVPTKVREHGAGITVKCLTKQMRKQCLNKFNPDDIALKCITSLMHPTDQHTNVIYLTTGRTQSGKSTVKAVCAAVHRQLNCLLIIITKGVAERDDLNIKLNRLLGGCSESLNDLLVIADTGAQIAKATRNVEKFRKDVPDFRFGIIVDECDAMYRTMFCEQLMERRFKELMDLKPSFRMEISATIFSAFQALDEQDKNIELLGITTTDEYSGIHQMKHLQDSESGKEVYLKVNDLKPISGVKYSEKGLKQLTGKHSTDVFFTEDRYPNCDECNNRSGCPKHTDVVSTRWTTSRNSYIPYSNELVMQLLEQALEPQPDRKGTLVLVATNPRVYADNNVLIQATCVQNYFRNINKDFVALVATGKGVYFRLPGFSKGRLIRKRLKTISEVIEAVDKQFGLDTPVILFGYSRLSRCVSFRSSERVPTHMILTRGPGTSLEDYIQALGRATFNGLSILKKNGYENVTVLTNIQDFTAATKYYIFIDTFIKMINNDDNIAPRKALELTSVEVKLPDEANFLRHTNRKIGRRKDLKEKCPGPDSFETPSNFEDYTTLRELYWKKPLEQQVLMIIDDLSDQADTFSFSPNDIIDACIYGDFDTIINKTKLRKILRDFESNLVVNKRMVSDGSTDQWSVKSMDILRHLINRDLEE